MGEDELIDQNPTNNSLNQSEISDISNKLEALKDKKSN